MVDRRTEALAERQHGVVSYEQARALGMTPGTIRQRRETGRWQDLSRGVYRVAGTVRTPLQQAMAAVLGGGTDAVLSHASAAALVGLPGYSIDPIVITVPRRRKLIEGVRIEQSLALPAHHRIEVNGISCTSMARTLFDLCGEPQPRRAERALDSALARRRVTTPALWRVLDDLAVQGRNGTVYFRSLLMERGERYVPPESELESRFVELLARANLPAPSRQVDLGDADSWIGRFDFVWRRELLVVEVDGAAYHDGRLDQQRDAERVIRLETLGWSVLRFRWNDVVANSESVVTEIRDRLGRATSSFRGATTLYSNI